MEARFLINAAFFCVAVILSLCASLPVTEATSRSVADTSCICIFLYAPVCDTKTNKTYSNSCFASCAGAQNTVPGECDAIETCKKSCPELLDPVCVISKSGTKYTTTTYNSPCQAACDATENTRGHYVGNCSETADKRCATGTINAASTVCTPTGAEYPNTCYALAFAGRDAADAYKGTCEQKEAALMVTRCAPEQTASPCFVDPCMNSKCPDDSDAICVAKYCPSYFRDTYLAGQCQAVWINKAGNLVSACTTGLAAQG